MSDNIKDQKKVKITYPYRGIRATWFAYHPAVHGPLGRDGLWDICAAEFHKTLKDFYAVATDMYSSHQNWSETVGGPAWRKEILEILASIEKDYAKDVYMLEALASQIYDVEKRTAQRVLPYLKELEPVAGELRFEDSGLHPKSISPNGIVRRGWAS